MEQPPFPGAGQDGDEPPLGAGDDDWDADADLAGFLADVEAGREKVPGPGQAPAVMFTWTWPLTLPLRAAHPPAVLRGRLLLVVLRGRLPPA
jgi:hypothetical protein